MVGINFLFFGVWVGVLCLEFWEGCLGSGGFIIGGEERLEFGLLDGCRGGVWR